MDIHAEIHQEQDLKIQWSLSQEWRADSIFDKLIYYKATVIKIGCTAEKTPRSTEQHKTTHVNRGAKAIQWKKASLSNKWCWSHWPATCKIGI